MKRTGWKKNKGSPHLSYPKSVQKTTEAVVISSLRGLRREAFLPARSLQQELLRGHLRKGKHLLLTTKLKQGLFTQSSGSSLTARLVKRKNFLNRKTPAVSRSSAMGTAGRMEKMKRPLERKIRPFPTIFPNGIGRPALEAEPSQKTLGHNSLQAEATR